MKTVNVDDIEVTIGELESYQDSTRMMLKNGEITKEVADAQVEAFDTSISLLRGLIDEDHD